MKKSTIFGLTTGIMMAFAANSASAANPAYTLSPAPGVATDLMTIAIDFTDTEVFFYENSRIPSAVLENKTNGAVYICQDPTLDTRAMTNGKAYTMTFINENETEAEPITAVGEYELTIRSMYNEDGDLPVITASYVINYPVDYNLEPAANATVESISQVTLQFPETKNVKFYENNRMPVAVLENLGTGKTYTCQEAEQNTRTQLENGIEYTIRFVDEDGEYVVLSEPGRYELSIRSLYQEENDENIDLPAITTNYTIPFPVNYNLNPENGATVADLQTVEIVFPNNTVLFYENGRIPVAVLENTTTGKVYNCQEADRNTRAQVEEGGVAYTFTFIGSDEEEAMPITEPGQYTMTIRAMYQTVGEENVDLPVITANYAVAYPVDFTLYPDNGANAQNLQGIVLQFPATYVQFYENGRIPVAVLENTTTGKVYNCQEADRNTRAELEDGVEYVLNFIGEDDEEAMPITEPGQYTLAIRAMYQTVGEENVDLPVINASYTVPYPVAYYLNPESGASVENLMQVSVQFPENNNIAFYENGRIPVAVLENTTTGKVYNCQEADRDTRSMEGMTFTFTFIGEDEEEAMPITEPGKYTLTIRAFGLDNGEGEIDDLPAIVADYTINYPVAYYLNPDNGATVANLMQVSVQFPENNNIAFFENNRVPVAVLENTTTGKVYNCQEADRDTRSMEGMTFTFTFIGEDDEEAMPITEPGAYTLTISAFGLQDEDGEIAALPVINANYTIAYPVEYVLNPENGANVENLMTVSIAFPDNKNVTFFENSQMPVAVLENTTTGKIYNCQEADRDTRAMEGTAFSFTFIGEDEEEAMPITEPGKYMLTIRAFGLENEEGEIDELPVIVANYTIAYPVEYVLNPENGANVENLMTVSIAFPDNKNVKFFENSQMPVAVLENNATGATYFCQEADQNTRSTYEEGVEYTLVFIGEDEEEALPITEIGNYTLTIRALGIENEEGELEDLPVITANYTIAYPVEYILTPADGDYVEEIDVVTLEFPYNRNIGFYENSQMPVAVLTLYGEEANTEYVCMEADRDTFAQTDGVVYTFRFTNFETETVETITAKGTYKLVIKALATLDEDNQVIDSLPVISATYVIANSGVEAVEVLGEANVYNVYSINGIAVVVNGKADDVKNLPAGLYIINGQKVMIRK